MSMKFMLYNFGGLGSIPLRPYGVKPEKMMMMMMMIWALGRRNLKRYCHFGEMTGLHLLWSSARAIIVARIQPEQVFDSS